MKIILLERVEHLGQMGEVVTVKPGYARNFLLPRKKALRATRDNVAFFDKQKAQLEATNLKLRSEAESVAKTMEGVQIVVIRQASEVGHLYGSVRSQDVSEGLTAAGYTVNRSQVQIITPIKNLGIHQVRLVLHPEVSLLIGVIVAQSDEEAAVRRQAAAEASEVAA
ncbi:MAG: 50S ribosomal protein L9 [Pseudomonadota bacterium]|nr:50S ribosomal protein L9 [Alphaproteobacteria bacterium]MDP5012602.1 50S ribosomal protein L9 [Alphaproteobacteria bacterium]MDP5370417.1 50S ribosomal protein L9 [Pseudomonadota bacterium]